jgi:hypothetical protein
MIRNIVVTTATIVALAIVASAIPVFLTPAFADFDTTNSASQSASATLNANINSSGGASTISQNLSICQQIAQSGAFGSSSNSITGCP